MTAIDSINIYSLELKIEKLKELSRRLDTEINSKLVEIDNNYKTYILTKEDTYKNKNEELKKELNTLRIKQGRLKDDEIALVNDIEGLDGKYNIYNINLEKKVGYIAYSPTYFDTDIGSIGYEVYEPYRGHNYAYRSLKMLSGYLSKNGVEKVSVVADIDNIKSIKVMEKFKEDAKETINESEKYKSLKKYTYSIK